MAVTTVFLSLANTHGKDAGIGYMTIRFSIFVVLHVEVWLEIIFTMPDNEIASCAHWMLVCGCRCNDCEHDRGWFFLLGNCIGIGQWLKKVTSKTGGIVTWKTKLQWIIWNVGFFCCLKISWALGRGGLMDYKREPKWAMAPTVRQSGSLVRFTFVKTAPQKGRLRSRIIQIPPTKHPRTPSFRIRSKISLWRSWE